MIDCIWAFHFLKRILPYIVKHDCVLFQIEIKWYDCCTCDTYIINTDLFYGYVSLIVDGHARVPIIHSAKSCPYGIVFHKRVMLWSTPL